MVTKVYSTLLLGLNDSRQPHQSYDDNTLCFVHRAKVNDDFTS